MSSHLNLRSLAIAVAISMSLIAAAGCHRGSQDSAPSASVLTDTKLVDQNGDAVVLSSLKGKPLLVDFIYTSCPGPCLMETAKFANVALRLGNDLGSKVTLVSISVDPEHDGPKQLLDYSRQQGADEKGWYFLTGGPGDVDQALAGFKLSRQIEPDGSVGHLVNMMLIGPDGRLVREYNGQIVKAQDIVDDVKKTLSNG
ncbi:MAG TPA: SCO family protein [Candidatus Sulfotelmatobacter sp.]|jgi:protein SCO1/2|nr:SCO family protein [Candidatus Sulfotelmatobacter sp.]